MSETLSERLYPHLPVSLQNLACSYYGYREGKVRFGRDFERRIEFLQASERWTVSDIEAYQDERIRQLVAQSYARVPFYRDRMKALKLTPADIRCRADLEKLPILTKEDVRANLRSLIAEDADPGRLIPRHTSGTTGKSLDFFSTQESISFQWAVWWRHRMRFGLQPGDWHANFTGKLVVPIEQRRPPFLRVNYPGRQVLINMQHIEASKIDSILDGLEDRPLRFWSGYPSIIHQLARLALERGRTLRSGPGYVVTGAENMLEFQRRDIAAFSGAKLTDQYGLSEGAGNASRCEHGIYHEDFEFCVLECKDPQKVPRGTQGTIVMTGFACPEFPFIRYDTGDVGIWNEHRCECGRVSRTLVSVEGRAEDYVLTPEGRRIMRFDYCFKDTVHVEEAQVVQERLGAVKVRIVKRPAFRASDEAHIAEEIHRWISPKLDVEFEYVPGIERERGGKFRAVRSMLPKGA